jgi:hypothetical protein
MMMPPLIWLSSVFWSMIRPQSWTPTTLSTVTRPVSVSTETSANCTPQAWSVESPSCHCRGPRERADAEFFAGGEPVVAARVGHAGLRLQLLQGIGANVVNRRRTEGQVVLPPLPGPGGKLVSPTRTVICSGLSPSISAATTAMTVLVPVPMSCTPRRNSMLPSGLIWASPWVLRVAALPARPPRRSRCRF